MSLTTIKGIDVHFPFVPYEVQIDYMSKVIECLQEGVNGVLESPTGTGKTLCLLCSVLAWLETRKAQHQLILLQHSIKNEHADTLKAIQARVETAAGLWNAEASLFMVPKVIYGSRTHTQLSQAIQELKRSHYKHVCAVVIGSRDQLCVHPEVSKLPIHATKLYACRGKIVHKSCVYYLNFEEKLMALKEYQNSPVMDIEDLVALGKKNMFCPYFAARTLKSKADVVFAPYNYIIDPKTRRSQGIELENNIVIIDEAHNIDSACEQSMSFIIKSIDLAMCISELTQTVQIIQNNEKSSSFSSSEESASADVDFTLNDVLSLKVMFCELESVIDKDITQCPSNGILKPGDYMLEILTKVELTPEKRDIVTDLIEKIVLYLSNTSMSSPWNTKGVGLQKVSDMVKVYYSRYMPGSTSEFKKELVKQYGTFLQMETPKNKKSDVWTTTTSSLKQGWKVEVWCFSPEIGMQDISNCGVHSIILTSGTLSPLDPFIKEMGIYFPVQLENPHIIEDKQILVAVINQGPDGTILNSSYQNRSNEKYISSLGRSLTNFCRVIPSGVLIFFPSYSVMKGNIDHWEKNGIWQNLAGVKPVYVEPQGKDAFQESMDQFYSAINTPDGKGAALLAVLRGKVSEGLDFANDNARAVFITGLPFPPWLDPRIKAKMQYLDNICKETNGLRGSDWYSLQASRAVNQAIGRVIRHKDDYGAIFLCDNRFSEPRIQFRLSKWIQGRIKVFNSFGPALKQVACFFKEIEPTISKNKSNQNMMGSFTCISQFTLNSSKSVSTSTALPNGNNQHKCTEEEKNIFQDYVNPSATSKPSTSKSSTLSIFDAMDHFTETRKIDPSHFPRKSTDTSSSNTVEDTANTREAKRRKINIQFRQANQSESDQSESGTDEREMWKQYLKEVKNVLGATPLYSRFCSSVKTYKASKNTLCFARDIKEIFSQISEKISYIQRTSLLVTSQERHKFLSHCLTDD